MNSLGDAAAYAEILEDTPKLARERERLAFERAIDLLEQAAAKGSRSREAFEASNYLNRLWSVLIEDLASPENDLPPATRADLISIGIWVLREMECIRLGRLENFFALIDVTKSIREGLR